MAAKDTAGNCRKPLSKVISSCVKDTALTSKGTGLEDDDTAGIDSTGTRT